MMNDYEEGIIYNGNIMKIVNREKVLVEESAKILYNSENDTFFPFHHFGAAAYFSLIMDDDRLSDKEIKEYHEKFNKYNYNYGTTGNEGETYIDINSIVIDNIEKGSKRGR